MRNFIDTLLGWGPVGVFAIAVLDSAGVPMPGGVDALVLFISAMRPGDAWTSAAAAIVGAMLGSWFLFTLARKGGEAYLERHTISPRTLRLRVWFQRYGLVTVFVPALLPVPMPLKIPVLCAGALGVRRRMFLGVMLAARVPHYLGLAWLGRQLGTDAGGWLKVHAWQISGFALLLVITLFALIWFVDRDKVSQ